MYTGLINYLIAQTSSITSDTISLRIIYIVKSVNFGKIKKIMKREGKPTVRKKITRIFVSDYYKITVLCTGDANQL